MAGHEIEIKFKVCAAVDKMAEQSHSSENTFSHVYQTSATVYCFLS